MILSGFTTVIMPMSDTQQSKNYIARLKLDRTDCKNTTCSKIGHKRPENDNDLVEFYRNALDRSIISPYHDTTGIKFDISGKKIIVRKR